MQRRSESYLVSGYRSLCPARELSGHIPVQASTSFMQEPKATISSFHRTKKVNERNEGRDQQEAKGNKSWSAPIRSVISSGDAGSPRNSPREEIEANVGSKRGEKGRGRQRRPLYPGSDAYLGYDLIRQYQCGIATKSFCATNCSNLED